MASIVGKKISGKTYYYLVESARVGGRPRIVSQRYLGPADEVTARLAGSAAGEPERTRHLAFGDLAAVWGMLDRLGYAGIIDEVTGGRRSDANAGAGTYLALACANRVVAPRSKLAFADWWSTTAGARVTRVPWAALDHRRFWDAMNAVDQAALTGIERRLAAAMAAEFGLGLSSMALDMTNFATYIDTGNGRAPIAQRGHAKQKRTDLRLVGLGMVVTRDGGVPLVGHAYPGNYNDVTVFPDVVDELVARYRAVAAEDPDLLAIPARRLAVIDAVRFPGLTGHETRAEALGATRRVLLTHSATLHARQSRGFDQTSGKAVRKLAELAARLERGRTRRGRAAVEADIAKITRPRWLNRVITTTLAGDKPSQLRLTWTIDEAARAELETELFGKRILVTSRENWPVPEVVAGYRSQYDAEAGFRQLKDPRVVSFSPMHHWTDQKIRVHVSYCVTALAIAHLMRRQARAEGLDLSVRVLLAELAGIQETVLLYPSTGGRPRARRMLTEMTMTQQRLYEIFGLDRYAPAR